MSYPMPVPKVKICCIKSRAEAELAIEAGAYALGLVGHMPSGPGVIEDELIAKIVQEVPETVHTFLLTSEQTAESIIRHHEKVKTSTIQIVDYIGLEELQKLHTHFKNQVQLVQVIHVEGEEAIDLAKSFEPYVDMLLLDSGNTKLSVKQLGGTGRTHDWSISKTIVDQVRIPVFLAGGLNASNVQVAVSAVGSFGLDLCSGVRSNDQLDRTKLLTFFEQLNQVG